MKQFRGMITGISGFVGSQLASHLSSQGWDVAGYDVREPRVKYDFHMGDLADGAALQKALVNLDRSIGRTCTAR